MTERPSERRSGLRTTVVWETLRPVLDREGGPLDVLDIGGGTGGFAVRVAAEGHRVRVVDPSPDALASLGRRAREVGVTVDAQQGDLVSLAADAASADLVLCHGVLELSDDPGAALERLHDVLRPGGTLSLVVAQRNAAVIARAMAGHFGQALELLDDPAAQGRAGRRFTAGEARSLLEASGFQVATMHAVRVFADLVPGNLLDLEPGSAGTLLELERAVATRPDFLPLAAQVHLMATR